MKKAILLLFSSFLLITCSDIDQCTSDSGLTYMVITFHDAETKTSKKSGFRIFEAGSTTQFGLSDDSLAVGLPLDPMDTSLTFLFDTDTLDYTLKVRYDPEFSLFDPGCDPSLIFTGLDTLNSTFDSTAIIGRVTDRLLPKNIEVYF